VELLITLLLLYALQCVLLLPRGAVLFFRSLRDWRHSEGPGWRLANPLPSAPSTIGLRLPLVEDEAGLRSRGFTPWLGATFAPSPGPRLEPGRGQEVEVRGAIVRVDGRPFLRAASKGHAAALGSLISALAREGEAAWQRVEQELAESCSVERARTGHLELEQATRWLRPLSDANLFALFAVLPGMVWWLHAEAALFLFLPAYGVFHVATVTAFALTHRRLFPEATGERVEQIIGVAFYPPLLLRAVQNLRFAVLGFLHPAAIAALVLPRDLARDFLRSELARTQHLALAALPHRRRLVECEYGALAGLARELGTTPEELLAPPKCRDTMARSYCPACLCEYRFSSGKCSDCAVPLQAFAA